MASCRRPAASDRQARSSDMVSCRRPAASNQQVRVASSHIYTCEMVWYELAINRLETTRRYKDLTRRAVYKQQINIRRNLGMHPDEWNEKAAAALRNWLKQKVISKGNIVYEEVAEALPAARFFHAHKRWLYTVLSFFHIQNLIKLGSFGFHRYVYFNFGLRRLMLHDGICFFQ
jgi:hypothetical protein